LGHVDPFRIWLSLPISGATDVCCMPEPCLLVSDARAISELRMKNFTRTHTKKMRKH